MTVNAMTNQKKSPSFYYLVAVHTFCPSQDEFIRIPICTVTEQPQQEVMSEMARVFQIPTENVEFVGKYSEESASCLPFLALNAIKDTLRNS